MAAALEWYPATKWIHLGQASGQSGGTHHNPARDDLAESVMGLAAKPQLASGQKYPLTDAGRVPDEFAVAGCS